MVEKGSTRDELEANHRMGLEIITEKPDYAILVKP